MNLELELTLVLPIQSCIGLGVDHTSPRDEDKDGDYSDDSNKLSVVFNTQSCSNNVMGINYFVTFT